MAEALFTLDSWGIIKSVVNILIQFWPLLLILVAVIVLRIFFPRRRVGLYEYYRKEQFMTPSERYFFNILSSVVPGNFYIFAQVHLPTIIEHKIKGQNWNGAFRHIDEKSVDFVVCDKASMKPLLAIELDDRSHERPDRVARDREVERILQAARMPLLRFNEYQATNRDDVLRRISEALK